MENNNSEPTNEIAKQLKEINRSLSFLIGIAIMIGISQVNSCIDRFANQGEPVQVHVTNMNEVPH